MPAPTKTYTWNDDPPNTNVIHAAEVNKNFDDLYGYLQGGVDTLAAGAAAANLGNAAVSADKLASADKLGLSGASTVRRGAFNVPGAESRTNTAYGFLASPDRIQNVVLPNNGLIVVAYQATWQESVAGAGRAAIFVGSNQLQTTRASANAPTTQAAATNAAANFALDRPLFSSPIGLVSCDTTTGIGYGGEATTGQVVGGIGVTTAPLSFDSGSVLISQAVPLATGGLCHIFAAAGTYDVGVQFKASSGSVTAKNRKLWVWTIGF